MGTESRMGLGMCGDREITLRGVVVEEGGGGSRGLRSEGVGGVGVSGILRGLRSGGTCTGGTTLS